MDRVFTPDGRGVVNEVERRQGRTWLHVSGRGFEGWYLSHEVTAEIGDHNVVNLSELPDRDDGAILPWDPEPRDLFRNQLTIQPTSDLPPNLDDTPSIKGLKNYRPEDIFPGGHMASVDEDASYSLFGRTAHARHLSAGSTDVTDLPDESDQIPGNDKDSYQQVPSSWKGDPPGLSDYGDDYDEKNPANYGGDSNEVYDSDDHDDGPFSKSSAGPEFEGDPGAFERTDDEDASPGEDDPFFENRESSYHVAATGDGYVVLNDFGGAMSRHYSTEGEAVHHARFAAYEDFLDRDPMARQAAWADVRKKALRLRSEGSVRVSYYEPKEIQAEVQGDNGLYDTSISRKNAFGNGVTYYNCSCPWGQWAFKRQYTYVGRFCSHGLAAYHEMQSLDNKGVRSFNEDQNPFMNPAGGTDLVNFTQHIGSTHEAYNPNDPYTKNHQDDPEIARQREEYEQGLSTGDKWDDFKDKVRHWFTDDDTHGEGHGGLGPAGMATMMNIGSTDNEWEEWLRTADSDDYDDHPHLGPGDFDGDGPLSNWTDNHPSDGKSVRERMNDLDDEKSGWHPKNDAWKAASFDRYYDVSMLNDTSLDYADGSDLTDSGTGVPAQPGHLIPVGQDPSHTVNPADGEMQVFSDPAPPMSNNDNDAYGRSQDHGNPAGILNGLLGGGDPLEGTPVPHQPDGDVAMEGIEVAHSPMMGGGEMPDINDADGDGYSNPGTEGIDPSALMGDMPQMGQPGDSDIAQMAQQFLAKTSAKNYSLREQEELMHEKGSARQFGELNISNSLYEQPRSFLD